MSDRNQPQHIEADDWLKLAEELGLPPVSESRPAPSLERAPQPKSAPIVVNPPVRTVSVQPAETKESLPPVEPEPPSRGRRARRPVEVEDEAPPRSEVVEEQPLAEP